VPEYGKENLNEFEVCIWPPAAQRSPAARLSGGIAVELAARMRGMWRNTSTGPQ
jgi:hypothetical protein